MNNTPLVSIVIPVYNGANYLAEAIDSALSQTYKNIEILVINDGSKDDGATRRIALCYGDRIRYFEKENGGVASALNLGIQEMQGEYFSWLSHDDVYLPQKVEAQIAYLQHNNEKSAILYSDFCYIDENSKFLSNYSVAHIEPEAFRIHFIMGGIIHGCTLLIPAICFKTCGVFKTELRTTQDYELWFRFSEKFKFIHIPEILVKSRVHPQQDSTRLKPLAIQEYDNLCLHFIKSIRRKEITSYYPKPLPIYYFDYVDKMAFQKSKKAGKHAFYLGLANVLFLKRNYVREFFKRAKKISKEYF